MDLNKLKFTKLENEVIEFLFKNPTTSFNGKELANKLKVSPTAIAKSVRNLAKLELVTLEKKILLSIQLNRDKEEIFDLKRISNLKSLYTSGLAYSLDEKLPGAVILVFGSYSSGEDTEESDIDIAIIGTKEKPINISKFENKLQRKIQLHFFKKLDIIENDLKESIINGITLKGAIQLWKVLKNLYKKDL